MTITATSLVRILIVDDQRDITMIIGQWMAKNGYDARTLNDSRQALETLRDFRPDIVILDISMPHMDGYEVARQVRGEPGFEVIPIVACTTFRSGTHLVKARAAGFTHHLPKPCDLSELEALINMLNVYAGATPNIQREPALQGGNSARKI